MSIEHVDLVSEASLHFAGESFNAENFTHEMAGWFESFSGDLKSKNLASRYLSPLVKEMSNRGCNNIEAATQLGATAFYRVAKDLLGPLHTAYVDTVVKTAKEDDILLFAARDATPFYWIAKTLLERSPDKYSGSLSLVHADWNRWFMGQEDELELGEKPLPFNNPLLGRFYRQLGFGSDRMVKIVEPGCWGSAANAVKLNMPDQQFELWFLFSHMPDRIYGFLNEKAPSFPELVHEVINDTGEAQPKPYLRPTRLVEKGDIVIPDFAGRWIPNPTIQAWAQASTLGSIAAAIDFDGGKRVNIEDHVGGLVQLSNKTDNENIWTGMLPENTQHWQEGDAWIANWKWSKILPLK